MSPIIIVCAIGAACLYAIGALSVKSAMQLGAKSRRAIAVTNLAMALWALPLFFILPRDEFAWSSWWFAVAAGAALFIGRIFSVKALEIGDLSVVGPLLGMKTLLVALFTFLTGQAEMSPGMWIAAICASAAVMLVQRGPSKETADRRKASIYAFLASLVFALTDILVVEARGGLSVGLLSPTLFLMVAILAPFLGKIPREPAVARRPLYTGAAVMGFQTTLIVMMIGLTGQAVLINIIYCSRVLWTVLVDMAARRYERGLQFFCYRIAGAVFLIVAVCIVILENKLTHPSGSEFLADGAPPTVEETIVKADKLVNSEDTLLICETPTSDAGSQEALTDIHWPY